MSDPAFQFPAKQVSRRRVLLARAIGMSADALQIVILPYFIPGIISPVNAVLDVVVAAMMIWLVGWHIAFLPAFLAEQVPMLNLAPTWTIAVLIATRGSAKLLPPPPHPQVARS